MTRDRVIRLLRPGWSRSRARSVAVLSLVVRAAVMAFVLHVSGAAHMLADILLDDDMTCVDEQAHHGSTAPHCPAAQGVGQGQRFVPAARDALRLPPAGATLVVQLPKLDAPPPFVAPGSIERPPRV